MDKLHRPVLLQEVLATLAPRPGESYLDLTAGYGGHAKCILDVTRNHKDSVLVDRDAMAVECLEKQFPDVSIRHTSFYDAALQEIECGMTFDLILADFGVSSPQLDRAERGFAFAQEGPLDMRMDRRQELTADRIVNKWSRSDLERILQKYGELSPKVAAHDAQTIIYGRPWKTTSELAAAFEKGRRGKIHPATRVFQAIRIAVNDELGQIERTLPLLPKLLKPGGRVALITFHSLEDRLVKNYFREASSYGEESELKILTTKPIVAEQTELFINPRARSAKLRAAERI